MSRWSDRRAAAIAAAVISALMITAVPAAATPDPVTTAPVEQLTLPVVDLMLGSADTSGLAEVRDTTKGADVRFDASLLFGRDSAELRPRARQRIAEVGSDLKQRGAGRLTITGYTDDLGSAAHGLDLSRRRAQAVAAALRTGLPAKTYPFTVSGRGEADPVVPNDSEAHRRQNRRVELSFVRTR